MNTSLLNQTWVYKISILSLIIVGCFVMLTGCGGGSDYLDETAGYLSTDMAEDQKVKQDITSIRSALILYFQENNVFPERLGKLEPDYLEVLPKSPVADQNYEYKMDPLGNYELIYELSDGEKLKADMNSDNLPI